MQSPASGALSYLMFAGIGGFVGYYFAKKRTEHEVGYLRRVEVVERIQRLVVLLAEEFEAALEYIREPGPTGNLPAKKIESSIEELERYYVQQEIWLNRDTLARLDALVAQSRARQRDLARASATATRTSSASTRGSGQGSTGGCAGTSSKTAKVLRIRSGPCSGSGGGATGFRGGPSWADGPDCQPGRGARGSVASRPRAG